MLEIQEVEAHLHNVESSATPFPDLVSKLAAPISIRLRCPLAATILGDPAHLRLTCRSGDRDYC